MARRIFTQDIKDYIFSEIDRSGSITVDDVAEIIKGLHVYDPVTAEAQYAQASVEGYVEGAEDAADAAAASAAAAANSASAAAGSASDAAGSAQTAKQYSGKPPVIQDGTWWTWNAETQKYVDTHEAARGNLMYATFYIDAATGGLYMVTDNEYTGPQFRLNGADLEVVLNYG